MTYFEKELIRQAMDYVISRRMDSRFMTDSEFRDMAEVVADLIKERTPMTERETLLALGKKGTRTFDSQGMAEDYLRGLPCGYAGATRKQESGKWMVSYHRIAGQEVGR